MADQLAMHSSLAVLAERMATIQMKATGKRQLLEVVSLVCLVTLLVFANIALKIKTHTCCAMFQERVSDRLEGERQEQAIRLYLSQANELDQWLEAMHTAVTSMAEQTPPAEVDNEDQLSECEVRAPSVAHVDHCMKLH